MVPTPVLIYFTFFNVDFLLNSYNYKGQLIWNTLPLDYMKVWIKARRTDTSASLPPFASIWYNVITNVNHGFQAGFSRETQLTITFNDFVKSSEKNAQTDIAILDFDMVPWRKLLHKLDSYGITL